MPVPLDIPAEMKLDIRIIQDTAESIANILAREPLDADMLADVKTLGTRLQTASTAMNTALQALF